MGILIKGVKMPEKCYNCLMCDLDAGRWFCVATLNEIPREQLNIVQENCPLVELPTPHGRLIDADEMCADLATVDPRHGQMVEWSIRVTEVQKTVIEAEE